MRELYGNHWGRMWERPHSTSIRTSSFDEIGKYQKGRNQTQLCVINTEAKSIMKIGKETRHDIKIIIHCNNAKGVQNKTKQSINTAL